MKTTGQLIRDWRIGRKLTQVQACDLMDTIGHRVAQSSWAAWEAGDKLPTPIHCDALHRISREKLNRQTLVFGG